MKIDQPQIKEATHGPPPRFDRSHGDFRHRSAAARRLCRFFHGGVRRLGHRLLARPPVGGVLPDRFWWDLAAHKRFSLTLTLQFEASCLYCAATPPWRGQAPPDFPYGVTQRG